MKTLDKNWFGTSQIPGNASYPRDGWDTLPVKVLQFGTGVLLRGLPDYFIDKANQANLFNGRILVVKSTSSGSADAFEEQNGLYTVDVKGVEVGISVDHQIVNASIAGVLNANSAWDVILSHAANKELELVISNTTELGLVYDPEDRIEGRPPRSFPGKLAAFLYERYRHFEGSVQHGLVIVPTELVDKNGELLKSLVIRTARHSQLEEGFFSWLEEANNFCNSLVDRIVPGKLPADEQAQMESRLGYKDSLMIRVEPFRLWAIESDSDVVRKLFAFRTVDEGLVVTSDISVFKELKLRLLNATHTFSCGVALLFPLETVKDAMENPMMEQFISGLLYEEIAPVLIANDIPEEQVNHFSGQVLDRFRNKSLRHRWQSISMNFSLKMAARCVELIVRYVKHFNRPPERMALAFAAFIFCMKEGNIHVDDEQADFFRRLWTDHKAETLAGIILAEENIWNVNLEQLPEFRDLVKKYLMELEKKTMTQILNRN